MNNTRRKEINAIISSLETIKDDIDSIMSDEQDYLGNIPENLQSSERYEAAESAVDSLQEAMDNIDSVLENLETAKG